MAESSSTSQADDRDLWQRRKLVYVDGVCTVEGRPRTEYKVLRIEQPANIPGKSVVSILISLPPRSATPPHTHNGAAVFAQVIKGRVISQMIHQHDAVVHADGKTELRSHDSGVGVYGSGEMWYEAPGCHHVRAENPSDKEEASFFANFIIDTDKLHGSNEGNVASRLTILDVDPKSPYYQA